MDIDTDLIPTRPLSLILSILKRHQSTLQTPVELQKRKRVIVTRSNHDQITQLYRSVNILKQTVELQRSTSLLRSTPPAPLPAAASLALITRNRVTKAQMQRNQRAVATDKKIPLRRLPIMLLPSEHISMFTPQDWLCTLYPQEADSFSRLMSSINIILFMKQSGSTVCLRKIHEQGSQSIYSPRCRHDKSLWN
jgi:hypothetical protein